MFKLEKIEEKEKEIQKKIAQDESMSRILAHEKSLLSDSGSQKSAYFNGNIMADKIKNKNSNNLPLLKQSHTYMAETELLNNGGHLRHKVPIRSINSSRFSDKLPEVSPNENRNSFIVLKFIS